LPRFGEQAQGRRERAAKVGAPHLVPALLALLAIVVGWALWGKVSCGPGLAVASPETQVRAALAGQERARISDIYGFRAGGTAALRALRYPEVSISMDGDLARVIALVESEGDVAWKDEQARLSYVGRELFTMTRCRVALWCADGNQFSRLRSVLTTLFRREDAFNGRDADAYGRLVSDAYAANGGKPALVERLRADFREGPAARVRIVAWQIRVERDRAIVGEDYVLELADEPARTLRARYELAREGERWTIVDGL
jgi:hypothetical protein